MACLSQLSHTQLIYLAENQPGYDVLGELAGRFEQLHSNLNAVTAELANADEQIQQLQSLARRLESKLNNLAAVSVA